jgi:hypothetical protein
LPSLRRLLQLSLPLADTEGELDSSDLLRSLEH